VEESFLRKIAEQPPFTANLLVDKIYRFLEESIIRKEMAPGSKLREEAIAQLLCVSRSPVREALIRLEASGLVVRRIGQGRIVAGFTKQEILYNFEIWEMIESYAGGLASLAAEAQDYARIEEILQQMKHAPGKREDDPYRYREINYRFHTNLVTPCPNKLLVRMYENALKPIEWCWNISAIWHQDASQSEAEHEQIYRAYKRRDRSAYEKLVRKHIREAAKRFERAYSENTRPEQIKT